MTSHKFKPLRKSKGKKRKEIDEISRKEIVKTFLDFKDNKYSKIFDREYFYFNKQGIILTNIDSSRKGFECEKKSINLDPVKNCPRR